jgi:predicted metalloprotease with PDZ domain
VHWQPRENHQSQRPTYWKFTQLGLTHFEPLTRSLLPLLFIACLSVLLFQPQARAAEKASDALKEVASEELTPLQYTVGFSEANQHRITIDVLVPVENGLLNKQGSIELAMAVWAPGSYLIREFARNVEEISASDARTGVALPIRRVRKNRWRVETDNASLLRVSYRLYCHEMSVRTNWVDVEMGVLSGAATFLTLASDLEAKRTRPHHVKYVLPPNWSDAIAELPCTGDRIKKFVAPSYDALVDAPVVLGNPITESFQVGGVPHRFVCIGDTQLWDIKKATKDVAAIVATHHDFWKSVPYQRYTFLNVISEGRGGLEHNNSCLMMASRWSHRDPKQYRKWLGLASHEFFHTWNVRRLRPAGLETYDYETENYTEGLWVSEGVTSYYDNLLQLRAGKLPMKHYLKELSESIKSLEAKPGAKVQSLANSSHDAWIKFYRPDENSPNTTVSYYGKGSLVAWLLDTRIRIASENQKSLDDCMRELYAKHSGPKRSFTLDHLLAIVQDHADQATADWLRRTVLQPTPLDYQIALDCWGLTFDESDSSEDGDDDEPANLKAQKNPTETADTSQQLKHVPDLGVELQFENKLATIQTVLRGQPASQAGWSVDDELIALDDYRIDQQSVWETALKQLPAGRPTQAILSRRGRILSTVVTWDADKPRTWKLKALKAETKEAIKKSVTQSDDSPQEKSQPFASERQIQWRNDWLEQNVDAK